MKLVVILFILGCLGLGFHFKLISFDPLTFITLVLLLWNSNIVTSNQVSLANSIKKSHEVLAINQKELLKRMDALSSKLRNSK